MIQTQKLIENDQVPNKETLTVDTKSMITPLLLRNSMLLHHPQ